MNFCTALATASPSFLESPIPERSVSTLSLRFWSKRLGIMVLREFSIVILCLLYKGQFNRKRSVVSSRWPYIQCGEFVLLEWNLNRWAFNSDTPRRSLVWRVFVRFEPYEEKGDGLRTPYSFKWFLFMWTIWCFIPLREFTIKTKQKYGCQVGNAQ